MSVERERTSAATEASIQSTIRFHGRVQGVGFRVTVSRLADRHPVSGFVRNEPDGSVLMVAQGERSAIEALLEDIRAAFPWHISDEDRRDGAVSERFGGFSIAR